jgi:hypothetical protein
MVEPVDGSQNWQYLACYVVHNDTIEAYPKNITEHATIHCKVSKNLTSLGPICTTDLYTNQKFDFLQASVMARDLLKTSVDSPVSTL